jgi:acyl-CoA reductase-like NAD-dependent aldehyde dehydrogenase
MPRGVLNVLPGDGRVGAALCGDPRVAGISFTGSVPTGRAIARAAAGRVVTLEMGGKSPNLVFADADLTLGAAAATWGVFANTGQVCCASTRLLVQDTIADEFVAAILTRVAALRVGDPFDPATQLGPLACRPQYERVRRVVSAAVDDGAQVLVGGTRPAGVGDGGFYLAPTVVAEAKPDSALIREEVFGPVLAVERFCDEEEALALANEGSYGLAANIWTGDGGRMLRLAAGLEVGTVWGNSSRVMDPALPFGGFKDSGVGNAYGEGAVEGSTRLKRVSIRFDEAAPVPSWPGSPS